VVKEFGRSVSVDLFLASEIPPGTGLGSSASVCVNVLKALSAYLHIHLSKYDLAERAFHIARNVLGYPVGKQDEYAAVFGGLNYIRFEKDGTVNVEPMELDSALLGELQDNLMLFFTGATHQSQTILKEQEESTRQDQGAASSRSTILRALRAECEALSRQVTSIPSGRYWMKAGRPRNGFPAGSQVTGSTRCIALRGKTAPWVARLRVLAAEVSCWFIVSGESGTPSARRWPLRARGK